MFRSSLTWKNDKQPSELQHTSSTRLNYSPSQYSNNRKSSYENYSNRRSSPNYENSFNRRNSNYNHDNYQDNYREASSVQHSRYFPGK